MRRAGSVPRRAGGKQFEELPQGIRRCTPPHWDEQRRSTARELNQTPVSALHSARREPPCRQPVYVISL